MNVGFIGLGNMGKIMAGRILAGGHRLRVWNRSRQPVEDLVARGAEAAQDPCAAADGDVLISMLADDAALTTVMKDYDILSLARPSLVHVNMATMSIPLARRLVHDHRYNNLSYVAAPVLGRPDVASAGKLNILAAGDPDAIARVQPLFDLLGQKTWYFGKEPEQANAVKLCANFMIGCAIEAMSEAAALAKGYEIAPNDLLGLLTSTLFASPVYAGYGALIGQGTFTPAGFKTQLGLKDIGLALEAAEAKRIPMPFAGVVRDALLDAVAHGAADADWAIMARGALRRANLVEE